MHQEVIDNLQQGFEQKLFKAALQNLADTNNPLRANNFAYAVREVASTVLHRLAPDEEVLKCSWYKNEMDKENGITRRQRAIYAIQGGFSNEYVEELGLSPEKSHSRFLKAYKALNKLTHVRPTTFGLDSESTENLASETINSLAEFFRTAKECRDEVVSQVYEEVNRVAGEGVFDEALMAIDILSTHQTIEEIETTEVRIQDIDSTTVYYSAEGHVSCKLQWGSNSDMRNDMGAVMSHSLPFSCDLTASVTSPMNISVSEDSVLVDESSWFGDDD